MKKKNTKTNIQFLKILKITNLKILNIDFIKFIDKKIQLAEYSNNLIILNNTILPKIIHNIK